MNQTLTAPALACPDADALVSEHLPLARYAAHTVANRLHLPTHLCREDLVSSAQVALVEAARRYDPSQGASFATYVRPRLQGAVLDTLRANGWASRSIRAEARRLDAAVEALTAELGGAPSRQQVADRLKMSVSDLDALRHDIARGSLISIDEGETGAASVADTTDSPEQTVLKRERVGYLLDAVEALPDRVGEVIDRNFFNDEPLTDIANDMGLTLSRISQMRAQGLLLLHAALSEIVEGRPVPETGGSRARAQQRRFVSEVASASPDYRTRINAHHRPRPNLSRKVLALD